MEIAQTKHAFDMLNAFFTNEIANSGIAPEMIQVIKQHSEDYYSTTDDSFREKYTVEQVMVRLYFETLIDTFLPGQLQVSSFFINLLILEFQIFDAGVLKYLQITSIIRIRWYITRFLMLWSRQHFNLQSIFSVFTIIPAPSFRLTEMQ